MEITFDVLMCSSSSTELLARLSLLEIKIQKAGRTCGFLISSSVFQRVFERAVSTSRSKPDDQLGVRITSRVRQVTKKFSGRNLGRYARPPPGAGEVPFDRV